MNACIINEDQREYIHIGIETLLGEQSPTSDIINANLLICMKLNKSLYFITFCEAQ